MTFYLVRHADNDLVGHTLAGRRPGTHLNAEGREQAQKLATKLSARGITKLFSSPMERAIETAEPLAMYLKLDIERSDPFNELDFGDWTGNKFSELEPHEHWRQWNSYRLGIRPPNGEMMVEVQGRFVVEIERLRKSFPNDCIAIFSHGDPLKSALMYYLGMPLDHFQRLDIVTASYSVLSLSDWSAQVRAINIGAE